jgi:hypothetical protein
MEKPFRLSLKLKEGKSPHLYLVQIKEMMKNDTSLHPMMEKTLLLLKKTHTPYIMLATLREVVIDSENSRHFDRSAEPRGDWVCTMWGEDEIKDHKEDPQDHIRQILSFFEKMGYEMFNSTTCTPEYIKMLEDITAPQIEAQMIARSQEEFE